MDPDALNPAQSKLAGRLYHDVARNVVRKALRRWPELHDTIVSAAGLAVVQAVRCWDPERGISLEAFTGYRVKCVIRSDVSRECQRPTPVPCDLDFFPGVSIAEPGPKWFAMVDDLPPRQKLVIELLFAADRIPNEVAKILGTTRGNVCAYRAKALAHVRRRIEAEIHAS